MLQNNMEVKTHQNPEKRIGVQSINNSSKHKIKMDNQQTLHEQRKNNMVPKVSTTQLGQENGKAGQGRSRARQGKEE
jgi:hypothetical protein